MIIALAAIASAIFMGINIGGNNAAASMGAAYGARARTKKQAVMLIAVFSLLGAILSGEEVIKTLGGGLIPASIITLAAAIITVSAAGFCLLVGNILRVPISSSQSIVGAVVGIGLFYSLLDTQLLLQIVGWWAVTPVLAFVLAYLSGKYIHPVVASWLAGHRSELQIKGIIAKFLTISGCYVAFSAGANNAGNAVGPIVGAGLLEPATGAVLGGLTLGLGALLIGGRILQTVGTEITELCTVRAVFIEVIAAVIVHIASIMGIPVALGQIVPAAIIGIGCANEGFMMIKSKTVKRIAVMWVISPIASGLIAYGAIGIVS
jgi:PiT family inorganic phosphate transporter/sulfate permease